MRVFRPDRKVIPAGQMSMTFAAFAWGRILHIESTFLAFSSILFHQLYVMGGGQRLSFSEFEQNNMCRVWFSGRKFFGNSQFFSGNPGKLCGITKTLGISNDQIRFSLLIKNCVMTDRGTTSC